MAGLYFGRCIIGLLLLVVVLLVMVSYRGMLNSCYILLHVKDRVYYII